MPVVLRPVILSRSVVVAFTPIRGCASEEVSITTISISIYIKFDDSLFRMVVILFGARNNRCYGRNRT